MSLLSASIGERKLTVQSISETVTISIVAYGVYNTITIPRADWDAFAQTI